MYLTPHTSSAMAMFGFVYLWYLMVVLVLEIWFDYRQDLVLAKRRSTGLTRVFYAALTLGSEDISPRALAVDDWFGRTITIIGIPSAFLLHGYVGFIFGSIKANPWWSTPLMPIVFLFSAIVSGIAMVMLLYIVATRLRQQPIDLRSVDTIGQYLFYALLVDFSLEMLDLVHRLYEADESLKALDFMVHTRLWTSQVIVQITLGTLVPIALLALMQVRAQPAAAGGRQGGWGLRALRELAARRLSLYATAGTLTLIGVFAMRWNVVIGGQLFSKSFLGYTTYKMAFATREGLLPALLLMLLPFGILAALVRVLPPWTEPEEAAARPVSTM